MCCVSAATVSARREGLRGRPPSIEASRVREMKAQGMRPSDIQDRPRVGLEGYWGSLQRPKVREIEGTLRYLGWLIADLLEIPLSKFR